MMAPSRRLILQGRLDRRDDAHFPQGVHIDTAFDDLLAAGQPGAAADGEHQRGRLDVRSGLHLPEIKHLTLMRPIADVGHGRLRRRCMIRGARLCQAHAKRLPRFCCGTAPRSFRPVLRITRGLLSRVGCASAYEQAGQAHKALWLCQSDSFSGHFIVTRTAGRRPTCPPPIPCSRARPPQSLGQPQQQVDRVPCLCSERRSRLVGISRGHHQLRRRGY